ncbi:MAG: hypothetical protein GY856_43270, partial [bacterium]|nr:hypothetical protein [bacterium]
SASSGPREIGRIVHWNGPLWSRRYPGIVVSDEPEVQWKRLRYVLVGDPAPPTPPPPPTREVTELESGTVERGEIPVVEFPGRWQAAAPPKPQAREEPRTRGQPP